MKAAAPLMVILALAAPGAAAAQDVTPDTLMSLAERITARDAELSRLWPGFWPDGQPFILHNPDVGSVFAGDAAPAAPEFRSGPLPGALSAFEFDYPSGAPNTVALRISRPDDDLAALFHEQFHDFQQDAFRWIGGGHQEFIDQGLVPDRADFAARAEIERRVLAEALLEPDPAGRRRLARAYLVLRQARLGASAPELAAIEAHREWSEGTAQYVGLQGAAVAAGQTDSVRDRIVTGLRKDLAAAGGGFMVNWFRWRAYDVGAAMAWLLDDLGADWRPGAQAGERLDRLLDEALGPDTAAADPATVLAGYDLDGLKAEITDRLGRSPIPVASREAFLATAPKRLIVEVEAGPELLNGVSMSFQSLTMTPLPNDAMALPDAVYFVMQLGDYEVDVRDRSVLLEQTGRGLPRHVILLGSFDDLGELARLPEGSHARESLSVAGAGIRLTAGATRIDVGPDEILLSVRP